MFVPLSKWIVQSYITFAPVPLNWRLSVFFFFYFFYIFSSIFFLLLPLLVAISEEADFSLCLLILDGFDNLEKKILDF